MTAEEFITLSKAYEPNIGKANEYHDKLAAGYIASNSPVKMGEMYIIADIGVRNDLTYYKKKNRVFVVTGLDISYRPDGYPVIEASGIIVKSITRNHPVEHYDGTFKVIVHGAMSMTTFALAK